MKTNLIAGAVLALAALSLQGCGGGGDGADSAATSAAAAPSPKPAPVLIEEYGDSTTYGNGLSTSEPAVLQALLGDVAIVSNQGRGGWDSGMFYNLPWSKTMADSKARVVTINVGMNDAYPSHAISVDQYGQFLTALVQTARGAGKTVVLYEPNPSCDPLRVDLPKYVAKLNAVAADQDVPVVHHYSVISAMPDWQKLIPDCVHPSPALYAQIAQMNAIALAPMVKALAQ
ncbi:hypothetical protein R16034_00847 [Ralstonia edaphis]|uniref:SGNH hydrolase-type esterase domain-containing protein n=1 Tax=Ralstonia edaphi TaxID=3058599 RepID=A0AB72X167_9RALS|nr:SGNH/GDSL hydrolase family protein [Ralstonia sp. LMG 6871]CAJ0737787.1 hypothetical protein R16034_00847 [Ralstonia sp. LMG 6871]